VLSSTNKHRPFARKEKALIGDKKKKSGEDKLREKKTHCRDLRIKGGERVSGSIDER